VQEFFRYQSNQYSKKNRFEPLVTKLCKTVASLSETELTNYNLDHTISSLSVTITHLEEVSKHWCSFLEDKDLIVIYLCIGKYYEVQSSLNNAANWLKKGIEIAQNRPGINYFDIGTIWNNLGNIYESQGLYHDAEYSWKNALKLSIKFARYNENHVTGEDISIILNNLGTLYAYLGQYHKSELFLLKSLKIRQNLFENNNLYINQSLNNLACLRIYEGKLIEAENILTSISRTDNYRNSIEKISNLNNLALAYQSQDRFVKTKKCFTQALDIVKSDIYFENHLVTASLYMNVANLYILDKKHELAEDFLFKAKSISEINLEKDHPNIATIYNLLGECKFIQGKNKEAERFLLKSLSIRQQKLCPNHPDLIRSYTNLSCFYHLNGSNAKSLFYRSKM
jgi:tetratricopeptide (TPR) repeat protein